MKPKWQRRQQLQTREMTEALRAEAQRILAAKRNLKLSIPAFLASVFGVAPESVAERPAAAGDPGEAVAPAPT